MHRAVKKATEWTDRLWREAIEDWKRRQQDMNYRKYVARPALKRTLEELPVFTDGLFFDVGCGTGEETLFIRKVLGKKNSGVLLGLDKNVTLIQKADHQRRGPVKAFFGMPFDFTKEEFSIAQPNLIVSVFLLQEVPDVEVYFRFVSKTLAPSGFCISLLVHPDFAERLKTKEALIPKKKITSKLWQWAAPYPIVEKEKVFFVPYFHRTMKDYLRLAKKYFSRVSFVDVRPSNKAIAYLQRRKMLPLCNHPDNLYYPEIIQVPSLLIIKLQK